MCCKLPTATDLFSMFVLLDTQLALFIVQRGSLPLRFGTKHETLHNNHKTANTQTTKDMEVVASVCFKLSACWIVGQRLKPRTFPELGTPDLLQLSNNPIQLNKMLHFYKPENYKYKIFCSKVYIHPPSPKKHYDPSLLCTIRNTCALKAGSHSYSTETRKVLQCFTDI